MSTTTHPIPEGFHTITPYMIVKGADSAIKFYANAFGAVEISRISDEDGRVGFAELQIGDSRLMISDEYPEINVLGPQTLGGTSISLHLYVDDADGWAARAVAAGIAVERPMADQGDLGIRTGIYRCPFGHRWFITART